MHLGVVHLRLEARGRPFPSSPRPVSAVNRRVLRPLTRGPPGQPSPLRTPHGRLGAQGISPTSRRQAPHGWPMVHHSMVTGSPIPRGCCSAFSAAPPTPLRSPATSLSPVPRPVTHLRLFPAPLVFPISWGCCVVLATGPSLSYRLLPYSRVFTLPGRQQPCSAGPLNPIHPRTVLCALHGLLPSRSRCPLRDVPSPFRAYSPRPTPSHAPGAVVRP